MLRVTARSTGFNPSVPCGGKNYADFTTRNVRVVGMSDNFVPDSDQITVSLQERAAFRKNVLLPQRNTPGIARSKTTSVRNYDGLENSRTNKHFRGIILFNEPKNILQITNDML
tara:strand:+ start:230 stop:571 length:342 start_codon:yes stop_codon:yes gene_type:complete